MTDFPTTDPLARLDGALARIDAAIDAVTTRLDRSRKDHDSVVRERDEAVAELDSLRTRHAALQAKAEHAAERIDALIAAVERALAAPEAEAPQGEAPQAEPPAEAPQAVAVDQQPQPVQGYGYAPYAQAGR